MNKKVNEQLFLVDYQLAIEEKNTLVTDREIALEAERQKVAALAGFSDRVKETLLAEVIAEKEAEFNFKEIDEKIARFEKYLEDVEHPEDCECEECLAKRVQNNEEVTEQVM